MTEFIDVADDSGVFQKIRAFYIDGRVYPIHLLRGEHWEVGRRGDRLKIMHEQSWMREDEAHCLNDLPDYLGATNHTAILDFMAEIGLDFCGVDFAVAPEGKLVIFDESCHATSLRQTSNPISSLHMTERVLRSIICSHYGRHTQPTKPKTLREALKPSQTSHF